jgi:hypothetical protein
MINQIIANLLEATPTPVPAGPPAGGPPLSLTLILACTCLALLLVVGILVLGFIVGAQNRKSIEEEQGSADKSEKN